MNWSYFAGFLDGKGSIILSPPGVRLNISNTNKDILEKIEKFVGCGKTYEAKRKLKSNWKTQYCWVTSNHKDCLKILKKIRNKLIIKRKKCKQVIKYIENKRWQKDYISKKELEKYKGLSYRRIAKKIGVSPYCVFKYMRKHGFK